jgi:hypothetical protein
MPVYTATYFRDEDYSSRTFQADTPAQAMEMAYRLIGDADVTCVMVEGVNDRTRQISIDLPGMPHEGPSVQAPPAPSPVPARDGPDFDL